MCLFPRCASCGCRDRTRMISVEVFSGSGQHTIEQITRTYDGCGKEYLTVMDRRGNNKRLEEVMGD